MMSMVRIHQFSADAPDLVSPSATHTCGWLTHGRLLFFACAKKSNQKKHTPERATASSVPRPTGRSPTRRPHNTRLDSNRGSLKNSRWGCGTRRALRGGLAKPSQGLTRRVLSVTIAEISKPYRKPQMNMKQDRRSELAFNWMFAPVLTIAFGFAVAFITTGWDSIAYFFMILFVAAALCTIPVILGALALKGGTNHKEKALLAIMLPLLALFTYFVSFAGKAI
jgi:hypothetical protein